jgi:regulator of protease activity HflC (stomatin/prohibitin superfamily)
MKLRRTVVLTAAGLVVVGIGTAIFFSRCKWVPAGHVGVIFSASGGLQKEVITPRRVFVPWMSQLYLYPTMLNAAIYTNDPGQGEIRAADSIQVTTNDNANTPFDVVVWYSVLPENVHKVFNSFRAVPIEEIQSQHIRGAVRGAVNTVGTQYDAFQLMGPKRGEASDLLKKELVKIL